MNEKSLLQVRDLNVAYGTTPALKGITLDIPNKKITAIIGPSGCGKSTLLRAFNRLLEDGDEVSISGKVLVGSEDIYDPRNDVTQIRKKMGLLSQRPYPLPMSIYDNIAYGPRIHGLSSMGSMDEIV